MTRSWFWATRHPRCSCCLVLLAGAPFLVPAVPNAPTSHPPGVTAPPFEPIVLQRITLGQGITDASTPVFTDDGAHLLFFGNGHLWVVATNGSGLNCLSCNVSGEPSIPISEQEGEATEFPDDKRVFFGPPSSRSVLECLPSVIDCRSKQILPVDFTGGRPMLSVGMPGRGQPLPAYDIGGAASAKLAPDGVHIGFSDESSNSIEEMIIATLVRGPTSYTLTDPHVINPQTSMGLGDQNAAQWSDGEALYELKTFARGGADATYVSVGSPVAGNPDVIEVNLATGKTTRLTSNPEWDEDDAPSPDGSSLVLESDRTMHRTDVLGLLPVRGFADAPQIAAAAMYFVSSSQRRECDLQPWLLPASGDDGGQLLGQPLQPYDGSDVHAANNVSGYPQWSPDGTEIALNTESYTTSASAPYLVVAHLVSRRPTRPIPVVSSEPGAWSPSPSGFHGNLESTAVKVLRGAAAGFATVVHIAPTGILSSYDRVTYYGYSDDGKSFTSGTSTVSNADIETGPITINTDLTMTGQYRGVQHLHVTYTDLSQGWAVTGTETATLDGTTVTGPPAVPQACPNMLPRKQNLTVTATRTSGKVMVDVQSSISGAGLAENLSDTRPVVDATVSLGGSTISTDASGNASVAVAALHGTAPWTVTVAAGDTMVPASVTVS